MDRQTVEFYNAHSPELAQGYADAPSLVAQFFAIAFPSGSRVLEVGCGSGRDLNALLDARYIAAGIDASEAMIRQAERRFPQLAGTPAGEVRIRSNMIARPKAS